MTLKVWKFTVYTRLTSPKPARAFFKVPHMQTLLEKVKKIEHEATAIITQAEQQGKQAITDTVNRESTILAAVKDRATKQGRAIIKEAVARAQTEGSSIRQAENLTTDSLKKLAQKNKEAALKLASQLFEQDFLR